MRLKTLNFVLARCDLRELSKYEKKVFRLISSCAVEALMHFVLDSLKGH